MRIGAIFVVILLLSGFPLSSEVVLTDAEAAELQQIFEKQLTLSSEYLELSLTRVQLERQLRQALEKSYLASIAVLRSLDLLKTSDEEATRSLTESRTALDVALKSSTALESERDLWRVLAISMGGLLVLDILLRFLGR